MVSVLISSGKGGTGKSFIALSLALTALSSGYKVLLVDADVGNPSIKSLLRVNRYDMVSEVKHFKPEIDDLKCTKCGVCVNLCPSHALVLIPKKKLVFIDTLCEGCRLCLYACRYNAIKAGYDVVGWVYRYRHRDLEVVSGELRPGKKVEELIIRKLIEYLREHIDTSKYDLVVVDGPAGTSKKILELLDMVDTVVCVVESSITALQDFIKLLKLIPKGNAIVVLNKVGIDSYTDEKLRSVLKNLSIEWIEIPFLEDLHLFYGGIKELEELNSWSIIRERIKILLNILIKASQPPSS